MQHRDTAEETTRCWGSKSKNHFNKMRTLRCMNSRALLYARGPVEFISSTTIFNHSYVLLCRLIIDVNQS